MADELADKALEIIEVAKATGKIKKGANEVTKAIEKGIAKFVLVASDVNPPEIVMHIPLLAKEKGIPALKASTKESLGASAGLPVGTTAVAVVEEGEAKNLIKENLEKVKREKRDLEIELDKAYLELDALKGDGKFIDREHYGDSDYWNGERLSQLKDKFPNISYRRLEGITGISKSTIQYRIEKYLDNS